MRRRVSGGLLCGLIVGGVVSCQKDVPHRETEAAGRAAVLVKLGEFQRGTVSDRLAVAADLDAVQRADVNSEISGVIETLLHREGDEIETGAPVIRFRNDALRLAVDTKRIQAQQANSKVRQSELARREGQQVARQKELLRDQAQQAYDRLVSLSTEGQSLVSREETDAKRFEYEQAELEFKTALLQRDKQDLAREEAEQSLQLARVELATAEYSLSQSILVAPISGTISYLAVQPGEMVGSNTRAFTVVRLDALEARLYVPQRELARLRPGLPVDIRCEVFPDRVFRGRVDVVNPVISRETGTVELLVTVTDPSGFLRPGLFVTGEVILETRDDVVLVPKKALRYIDRKPVVFLVEGDTARRYLLEPGYSSGGAIEVRALRGEDGREANLDGARVVLVGHDKLKDGTKVEVESTGASMEAAVPASETAATPGETSNGETSSLGDA